MKILLSISFIVVVMVVFLPITIFAAMPSLIVCDGVTVPCDFPKLIQLGINLINFLIYLSSALAAVSFCYAGFLLITSAGSEGQTTKAKEIFRKTAIGFAWVLGAWLVINTIVSALVGPGYTLLSL
jgi:hypothetical protein